MDEELQDETNKFAEIVCLLIDKFCKRDDHSSIKALELQVLVIQFLLNSIPESLID